MSNTRDAIQLGGPLGLAEAQRRALNDKDARAFNHPDVAVQFGLLTAKVGGRPSLHGGRAYPTSARSWRRSCCTQWPSPR